MKSMLFTLSFGLAAFQMTVSQADTRAMADGQTVGTAPHGRYVPGDPSPGVNGGGDSGRSGGGDSGRSGGGVVGWNWRGGATVIPPPVGCCTRAPDEPVTTPPPQPAGR